MRSVPVKKHNQHHVWQEYLRSWTRGGGIYCLKGDRIFHTGTSRLGVATDFYKLQDWSDEDLRCLSFIFDTDKTHPLLKDLHATLLQSILLPLEFVKVNRGRLNNLHLIDEALEVYKTNAIEDYHCMIEGGLLPLLPRLLDEDLSWYSGTEDCLNFLTFISVQHMRTRGVKEQTINRLRDRMGLDISRIWDVAALMASHNIAFSLFLERKSRIPRIIKNYTEIPFITGDQPTLNLQGGDGESPPEGLSFFYPLSPKLALYLGEPGEAGSVAPVEPMTAEAVIDLNLKIARACHSQVFAETEKPLLLVQSQLCSSRPSNSGLE